MSGLTAPELRLDGVTTLPAVWHGRAFGIEIESNGSIGSVGEANGPRLPRSLRLDFVPGEVLKDEFPRGADVLVERSARKGRPRVRVELHPELGFHIWAPRFGRHVVSPDGTVVRSSVPRNVGQQWERLMLAQPLPLAAVLQGLELLHASAVRIDGKVIAFVAASGTGKTSVATHLVADGASLVTDDILAVEPTEHGVLAHPGGRLLHIADSELAAIDSRGEAAHLQLLGERLDKFQLEARISTDPGPLHALYFLERSWTFDRLELSELSPPSPKLLLAGAFLTYLTLPSRLQRQLELCARLATSVRTFRVGVPAEFGAVRLADEVRRHLELEL